MSLEFFPKSHRYKCDGRWIPGVTTLIKGGLPNDALKYWAAKYVAEWVADHPEFTEEVNRLGGRSPTVAFLKALPWQKRDVASERGTEVHAYSEKLVAGERVEVPDDLRGYVQAAVQFMDDWGIEPLVVEGRVAHRTHWWAGTGDLWARCKDGRVGYFDHKTTASGIYPETAFQAAAYTHAEFWADAEGNENPLPAVDFAAAVWLQEDTYDVIPVKADDTVYNEFRHLAFVADVAKRAKGDRSTPGYIGEPMPIPGTKQVA
jgi:hypothetical protein